MSALVLLVAGGCATGVHEPGSLSGVAGKTYGLELEDTMEAFKRGEGHQALAFFEQEAEKRERAGQTLDAAVAYSAATMTAWPLGLYQRAIRSGLHSMELLKTVPRSPRASSKQAQNHSHLAIAYMSVGLLKEAESHCKALLDLSDGMPASGRQFWAGLAWVSLATVALLRGDYQDALWWAERGIELLEDRVARAGAAVFPDLNAMLTFYDRRQIARGLWIKGRANWGLGNLRDAEDQIARALRMAERYRITDTEVWAATSLGQIILAQKDYPRALAQLQKALSLGVRHNISEVLVRTNVGIAESDAAQSLHSEADAAYRRAISFVEEARSQLQEAGLRSGFFEYRQSAYEGMIRLSLIRGQSAEAFAFAERARARAFLDLLGNATALSKGRTRIIVEEEVRLRGRLAEAQAMASAIFSEGPSPEARARIDAAEAAYRAFVDRVRQENLEQASLMTVEPLTLPEVQGHLSEGTTLLEYLVTDQETLAWVIGRQQAEVVRIPATRGDLVVAVRALRQAIEGGAPLEVVEQRSRALYDHLLVPARPHIHGDRLLVVPHDVLHYLPFGALRTPDGRWLIEEFTLSTLPSASVLKFLGEKEAGATTGTLALGNPDVGPALNLRYAEREARLVGARYPGATVLVRQDATETKAKALGPAAGLLHFATHGELNEKDPLSSALLLVPDGQEDGRLEVREIFGLDLKARLVVLSACETGLGQLSRGDELVGLQRAFLYAGTPAVVTTLWKVDDRASFRLMEHFYANLDANGPADALRAAQRATMAEFPHPFAWAGFGLTGTPK